MHRNELGSTGLSYDEENEYMINLTNFRKFYNIPAADIRAICKELGLKIVREGAEHFIMGENPYGVSNSYYLKHAIIEYRSTMNVLNTKAGNFQEYEIDMGDRTIYAGVHSIDEDEINTQTPLTPSVMEKPNKQPKTMLVPVDRGAELMRRKAAPPPTAPEAVAAPSGMDALQVLVAALTEAQRAAQPAPDPLHPQRALLEAEREGFLLTNDQLGQVLGMSKGTITSKKSGFRKLGFEFEKVKEGSSTTLWRVRRY
jgi:hypothetical protein